MANDIIESRVNYTVEQWDFVLRRWASVACYKSLDEAKVKAATVTGEWRIVKHTLTREIITGNVKGNV